MDIQQARMRNQLITSQTSADPAEVLRWMIAVQAQDYFGALWALGLRTKNASMDKVEQAFTDGGILRTHVMRPTWHFVAAEDIRWLVKLTAPRVHALNAHYYRQQKLEPSDFAKAHKAIETALRTRGTQTRDELAQALAQAGVEASGVRLAYVIMHAELELLLCSGPKRGKQFTYALVDDKAPAAKGRFDRKQALAEFAARYFASRGPATPRDLAYWSGLTIAEATGGLDAVKGQLKSEVIDGVEYWFAEGAGRKPPAAAFLFSNYDELGMSYKERGALFDANIGAQLFDYAYSHTIVINGKIAGSWRREISKSAITVQTRPIRSFTAAEKQLILKAAKRYEDFLGMQVKVSHGKPMATR
jgi:hypothetical protein